MNLNRVSRGRPKMFDEKEVLIVAMNYFWEHGYDNTSLDNLLKAMGITKSSFYSTFKSKEEIFSRCLKLYREQNYDYLKSLKENIGPKNSMLMLANMLVKELEETGNVKGCLIINSGKECYNKYKDLSTQIKIEFNFMQKLFTEFVKEAKDIGEIKNQKKAEIIAGRYTNSLNGLMVTIQAGADKELINYILDDLKEILE